MLFSNASSWDQTAQWKSQNMQTLQYDLLNNVLWLETGLAHFRWYLAYRPFLSFFKVFNSLMFLLRSNAQAFMVMTLHLFPLSFLPFCFFEALHSWNNLKTSNITSYYVVRLCVVVRCFQYSGIRFIVFFVCALIWAPVSTWGTSRSLRPLDTATIRRI